MAVWKLAPALAAGNCVVLKPAEQTPASILIVMELIEDLLPPGVLNIVNGTGLEAGKPITIDPASIGGSTAGPSSEPGGRRRGRKPKSAPSTAAPACRNEGQACKTATELEPGGVNATF